MPPMPAGQTHVCLPCLLRSTRYLSLLSSLNLATSHTSSRDFSSSHRPGLKQSARPERQTQNAQSDSTTTSNGVAINFNAASRTSFELTPSQLTKVGKIDHIRQKIKDGLSELPEAQANPAAIPFEKVLKTYNAKDDLSAIQYVQLLEYAYGGKSYGEVNQELELLARHGTTTEAVVDNEQALNVLKKLSIVPNLKEKRKKKAASVKATATASGKSVENLVPSSARRVETTVVRKTRTRRVVPKAPKITLSGPRKEKQRVRRVGVKKETKQITRSVRDLESTGKSHRTPALRPVRAPNNAKSLDAGLIQQRAITPEETPKVPGLSFDLSRVLFNPGVYHLQDPRSRVYNFDPYLENIMPVTEFNFNALNPYITSSEDDFLRTVSIQYGKRYIGSSSSMSGAMSQFHFLLSAWREIDPSILSKKISGLLSFTQITRAPASIFLRWRDGVYAIDADKEHDSPNILMMQGKSMEKLLTLEKDEFEKYRKAKPGEDAPTIKLEPEAYHYSSVGDFLLRSQLDAYDPRLPGTGMFDLKTRAVAGIRMNMSDHKTGMDYQIKERFGMWESYDREYYDMIRAAFLKYSLQVRMGRMDGIFVAYHNIARIFGFQYIPLEELDVALHGQADPVLGNREFKMTIKLMNEIFDQVTKEFPKQSLRFTFETREATEVDPNGHMQIFAEPMEEAEIDRIQKSGKSKIDEYEKSMAQGIDPTKSKPADYTTLEQKLGGQNSPSTLESNAADTDFLDKVLGIQASTEVEEKVSAPAEVQAKPVGCWTLRVFNEVNGKNVLRPVDIVLEDRWVVKYTLEYKGTDSKTRKSYTATRNRRSSVMIWDQDSKRNNPFVQKIRDLSESGRVWRAEQDALDAQRDKTVLYNHSTATAPES